MKKSYLLSCIAAAAMFVVADNLSAMEAGGGEHPARQMDALDQRALHARNACITQLLDNVRQIKDTLEHAIEQADNELQGGAERVDAAREILRTAYRDCKKLEVRFFQPMPTMPGEHREPKQMLLDGAKSVQDKLLQKLGTYARPDNPAMPGTGPYDLPYAGHPVMIGDPMEGSGETLREVFANILVLPLRGEGYMDHELESAATFLMYCQQQHQQ